MSLWMQGKHSKQISPTLQALKTLKQLSFLADSFPTFREPDFADTAFSVYLKKKNMLPAINPWRINNSGYSSHEDI